MDILTLLKSSLIISLFGVPATIIYLCFSFVFWGHRLTKRMFWKIVGVSVLISIIGTIEIRLVPVTIHLIYFFLVFMTLVQLILRGMSWADRIRVPLFAYFNLNLNEVINNAFMFYFIPREKVLGTWIPVLTLYPGFALYGFLTYWMIKRKMAPGKSVYTYFVQNKHTFHLFLVISMQYVLLVLTTGYFFKLKPGDFRMLTAGFFCIALLINCAVLFVILRTIVQAKEQAARSTQLRYISSIDSMFTQLRGQRHDFLNHVQVIHSMVNLEKKAELQSYAKEWLSEIRDGNSLVSIGHPLFAAMLENKMAVARNLGIEFNFSFTGLDSLDTDQSTVEWVNALEVLLDDFFGHVHGEDTYLRLSGKVEGEKLSVSFDTNCQTFRSILIKRQTDPADSTTAFHCVRV